MSTEINSSIPSNSEREVLGVLWKYPDSTAREIHEETNRNKPRVVTTTAKRLEIMLRKRLVIRDESKRPYRYRADVYLAGIQESVVAKVLRDVFDNCVADLVNVSVESGVISIGDARATIDAYAQKSKSRANRSMDGHEEH